jgi:hypothetical protein
MRTMQCKKCNEEKNINQFNKITTNGKIYYRHICKECISKYNKSYYLKEENKEKAKKRYEEYYENNKEKIREYQRKYNKKYYQENKEMLKEKNHNYWKIMYEKAIKKFD